MPEDALPFAWHPAQATRRGIFPILHDEIWDSVEVIRGLHWVPASVDISFDAGDWKSKMAPAARAFGLKWLAWFTRSDTEVVELLDAIAPHFRGVLEVETYLAEQKAQENIHNEAYNRQVEGLGLSEAELEAVRGAFATDPDVAALAAWVASWKAPGTPVGELLVADAFTEGVLFQGGFAGIRSYREDNVLPGVTEYNEYFMRDEGVHTITMCRLIRRLEPWARPTPRRIHEIAKQAVGLAVGLNRAALRDGDLPRISRAQLDGFIAFQADCVLRLMGAPAAYDIVNPVPFMEKAALNEIQKTNFFERRGHSYQELGPDALVFDILRTPIEY